MIGKIKRIGSEWKFLSLVIIIYIGIAIFDFNIFLKAVNGFASLFVNILPILALVFGFLFLTNLFFTPKRVMKHLGEESGIKGWILMIVGGIISTGPIYMWYPLLKDLKEKGTKNSLIATFIYNRAIKLPLLPMMIAYFGWEYTIILAFYMLVFSIINGVIVGKITR